MTTEVLKRAIGCLQGVFVGDAFGAQYEFMSHDEIKEILTENGHILGQSYCWKFIASGQITDDSEMAIALLRAILDTAKSNPHGKFYDDEIARQHYRAWLASEPFDVGNTIITALKSKKKSEVLEGCYGSKANGAMMRIAPLAIAWALHGIKHKLPEEEIANGVIASAIQDAELTHPNPVCLFANGVYAYALCYSIMTGAPSLTVVSKMLAKIDEWLAEKSDSSDIQALQDIRQSIELGTNHPPRGEENRYMGYVLLALQNAVNQILFSPTMEDTIVNSCLLGGDTDTTSCIAAAFYGAIYGGESIPKQWLKTVTECDTNRGEIPRNEYQDWTRNIKETLADLYNIL